MVTDTVLPYLPPMLYLRQHIQGAHLEDTVASDQDCLDATALEKSLGPVPAPGQHIVLVLQVMPPYRPYCVDHTLYVGQNF